MLVFFTFQNYCLLTNQKEITGMNLASMLNPGNFRDMVSDKHDEKTSLKVHSLDDDQLVELIEDHVDFDEIAVIIDAAYHSAAYQLENEN